ncbi:translation initiation factor 2B [Leptospira ryugenii]|uniref:Methylthioribose-1-phosphate isomerase n=1 Tax=Leptospira ryugenii TaxID=1917863 RepID=A0A2P2E4G0_9LEPT|nr:S-methyl-5-thioribose-1-phosphate isomerase [Leptospira ryugenii]GBF51763.1 translation initiation factor 2B [Leptospira ryugenii]
METGKLQPIVWREEKLVLLDQRQLPGKKVFQELSRLEDVITAIKEMVVRGAPAIAISGCFALALEAKHRRGSFQFSDFEGLVKKVHSSRPTAVNLTFALNQARETVQNVSNWQQAYNLLVQFAIQLMEKDLKDNQTLGAEGTKLFPLEQNEFHVITHCNTGALATAGHGTALGVIRSLRDLGKKVVVYADETRPFLQGSRLTAFEMMEEGIECYIISDGMSGWLMNQRKIDAVLVGCDRVARNGDTANKIGTLNLAIVAKSFSVPFFVCATKDSFDLKLETGSSIPIEMRREEEVTQYDFLKDASGHPLLKPGMTSPLEARALNPSFDVTPNFLIQSFITEMGCFPPGEIQNRLKG